MVDVCPSREEREQDGAAPLSHAPTPLSRSRALFSALAPPESGSPAFKLSHLPKTSAYRSYGTVAATRKAGFILNALHKSEKSVKLYQSDTNTHTCKSFRALSPNKTTRATTPSRPKASVQRRVGAAPRGPCPFARLCTNKTQDAHQWVRLIFVPDEKSWNERILGFHFLASKIKGNEKQKNGKTLSSYQ